jgi:hypothetical protein
VDKLNAYINFDYGRNSSPTGVTWPWKGIAGAAKFQLNDRFALMPRLQWFDDTNGFSTGTAQSVKEFTFTAGAKAAQGVLARSEHCHGWSDKPFFQKGPIALVGNQDNVTVAMVACFGPKR